MFFVMIIKFYTSRVVLDVLGVDDFGIYNVVGGIVILFTFINNVMVTSTQRFLNFAMGKGDYEEVSKIFSTAVKIHLILAFIIVFLSETIGLWYFHKYLVIPEGRETAAQWVFQMSVILACIKIVRAPYNASVIAHERMSFFALMSIIEAILDLAAIFLVVITPMVDHLISYSVWMMIAGLLITISYIIFCMRKFSECRNKLRGDKSHYGKLLSFSTWSLFGSLATTASNYGISLLMNMFYGVVVNAAMGIAQQVNNAVYTFATSLQTAINPQIVKSYGAKQFDYFIVLIIKSSRFSYLLIWAIALPVLVCCKECLSFWLTVVPDHTVDFCKLIIIYTLIDSAQNPLYTSVQATGKIKKYQVIMSIMFIMSLPIGYVILKIGGSPEMVQLMRVFMIMAIFVARIIYVYKLYGFPIKKYCKEMIRYCGIPTLLSLPIPYILYNQWHTTTTGIIAVFIFTFIMNVIIISLTGLKKNEKSWVVEHIKIHFAKSN